ncbi:MAG: lactate utilization protein C [Oscillospiraceae bacterium]|nr:lactate utilization protein C [Oscillospiraceae bacterium]
MNTITDALYERFKTNLESVNGTCVRTSSAKLAGALTGLLKELDIPDVCIALTPLLEETGVVKALEDAGIAVYTDHIRLHAETAKGGITESQYGIAELGTLVQARDCVDERIISTMSESWFGVVPGSAVVDEYDKMFELLGDLPEIPNFVGFITGPSRTADIECVGTVGVHGPIRMTAVVVDDK